MNSSSKKIPLNSATQIVLSRDLIELPDIVLAELRRGRDSDKSDPFEDTYGRRADEPKPGDSVMSDDLVKDAPKLTADKDGHTQVASSSKLKRKLPAVKPKKLPRKSKTTERKQNAAAKAAQQVTNTIDSLIAAEEAQAQQIQEAKEAGTPIDVKVPEPFDERALAQQMHQRFTEQRRSADCLYIGMDLHSDNVVLTVTQTVNGLRGSEGKVRFRKRIKTLDGGVMLEEVLRPFCSGPHLATVESTYNIYFLADIFEKNDWNLLIADPCAVSQARLKATNDYTDAEYLAEQLRNNALHTALILPHDYRAVRDFVRYRAKLVQDRAHYKVVFINMLANQKGRTIQSYDLNLDDLVAEVAEHGEDCDALTGIYPDKVVRYKAASLLRMIAYLDAEVELTNFNLKSLTARMRYVAGLQRINGVGPVLSSTIAAEIWDIGRFSSAKDFVSYCRLAPTSRLSNGKSKGLGNAKNGNAYLSWAMTELANMLIRYNSCAAKVYQRLFKKYNGLRVKAIRAIAARVARCLYHAIKSDKAFDVARCFGFVNNNS